MRGDRKTEQVKWEHLVNLKRVYKPVFFTAKGATLTTY
jgi:hypothetical protein